MRRRRLIAALGVALMCAPGTWLRSDVSSEVPRDIAVEQIAGSAKLDARGWSLAGVWQYTDRDSSQYFGGYSALMALRGKTLRAFSDRGFRLTFPEPDTGRSLVERPVNRQIVRPGYQRDLWDIESATRDPQTGRYWLGYENMHAIHRFTVASRQDGLMRLGGKVDWPSNSGIEAMIRLADGRFILLPEGAGTGLIYPSDPVEGAKITRFAFRNPAPGYAATDLAQLPDGRLLLLMRNTVLALPPFESLIAIGPPPQAGKVWAPQVALDFGSAIPRENYEGMTVREMPGGRVAIWLISDDNLSALQRTLVVKLLLDPGAVGRSAD